jgi:hypothetical protein
MVGNNETWYYSTTPLMLSILGGIVGDSAVCRAQSAFTKAWAFKHHRGVTSCS